jgi:hypothetical protein
MWLADAMADFIAAIDQGTTSTRCMLFDHSGTVAGRRVDLRVLGLSQRDDAALPVEHDEAAAGCALVDGPDVTAHRFLLRQSRPVSGRIGSRCSGNQAASARRSR